jgi:hypothetical protein
MFVRFLINERGEFGQKKHHGLVTVVRKFFIPPELQTVWFSAMFVWWHHYTLSRCKTSDCIMSGLLDAVYGYILFYYSLPVLCGCSKSS